MKKTLPILIHFFIFVFLTILTQVGGLIWLFSKLISSTFKKRWKHMRTVFFFVPIYIAITLFVIPPLASNFGRKALPHSDKVLKPATVLTVLLNRNYLDEDVFDTIEDITSPFSESGIKLLYMDACFPFWDGFPLLPHLSHNDGKKLDMAFIYVNKDLKAANTVPNLTGYGMFEEPAANEEQTTERCSKNRFYSATGWFAHRWGDQTVSAGGTTYLIKHILKQQGVKKLFLEPHLVTRWNIDNSKLRFHGCQAVRHDDHIHIEFR